MEGRGTEGPVSLALISPGYPETNTTSKQLTSSLPVSQYLTFITVVHPGFLITTMNSVQSPYIHYKPGLLLGYSFV